MLGESLRIAGAIPALVVMEDAVERRRLESHDRGHDAGSDFGVALHLVAFRRRQAIGFVEDRVADSDLADVVEQGAELHRADLGDGHAEAGAHQ